MSLVCFSLPPWCLLQEKLTPCYTKMSGATVICTTVCERLTNTHDSFKLQYLAKIYNEQSHIIITLPNLYKSYTGFAVKCYLKEIHKIFTWHKCSLLHWLSVHHLGILSVLLPFTSFPAITTVIDTISPSYAWEYVAVSINICPWQNQIQFGYQIKGR